MHFSFTQRVRAAQELLYNNSDGLSSRHCTAGTTPAIRNAVQADCVERYLLRIHRIQQDLTRSVGRENYGARNYNAVAENAVVNANESPLSSAKSRPQQNDISNLVVHRIEVRSYGIECAWNLLRHVYISFDADTCKPVGIHAGMSNYELVPNEEQSTITFDDCSKERRRDTVATDISDERNEQTQSFASQQLMFSTVNYYGYGRSEGYMLLCEECATEEFEIAARKNSTFFLPFNNCDTIVPFVFQTILIWFSVLGFVIGTVLCTQTFNVFVFSLFVPIITLLFSLMYNRTIRDEYERSCCELRRCKHALLYLHPHITTLKRREKIINYD